MNHTELMEQWNRDQNGKHKQLHWQQKQKSSTLTDWYQQADSNREQLIINADRTDYP